MAADLPGVQKSQLLRWLAAQTQDERFHARGYQGHVYLYPGAQRLVVKAAMGRGPLRWLRQAMLRNEARVYARLAGAPGVPQCYGLIDRRYLVLEHIPGPSLRQGQVRDREKFYRALFQRIEGLHARGVAHFDLKRRDNILVVDGDTPYIVDFGAAVLRKSGFAPLNRYLYGLARRFDFNAWVKLKYDGRYENLTEEDRAYYRRTWLEHAARLVKRRYLKVKRLFQH